MGTLGGTSPSAGFSCVLGIAADDEAISFSPPFVLAIGSERKGFDVEDGTGGLTVGSSADFAEKDVGSKFKVSIPGYAHVVSGQRSNC